VDACETWRALYRACHQIADDLREHMRLENDILFPQFRHDISNTPGPTRAECSNVGLE
jgi:regulator of cell morphogenesis and NO signaling